VEREVVQELGDQVGIIHGLNVEKMTVNTFSHADHLGRKLVALAEGLLELRPERALHVPALSLLAALRPRCRHFF